MNAADCRELGKQALACVLALGIWFAPIPAGLTREAWHLFAVFAAAIFAVIVNAGVLGLRRSAARSAYA